MSSFIVYWIVFWILTLTHAACYGWGRVDGWDSAEGWYDFEFAPDNKGE